MVSEQSFVQQLVQESLPVWEQCLHSEFLERLADGTLDEACFKGYIVEDSLYLREYAKDRIVLLISHRLYHFPQMQQVIFMENGETVVGTHDELMRSCAVYQEIARSQLSAAELA